MFGFQRLDAYRCAAEFLAWASPLAETVPRGWALGDQLRRAALSIPLNIAEGSGKPGRDGRRFYRIARGSALECAAILDAMAALGGGNGTEMEKGSGLLDRVVAMLTVMVRE